MSIKAYFDFITSITGIESQLNMPNRKKAADKNENDCSTNSYPIPQYKRGKCFKTVSLLANFSAYMFLGNMLWTEAPQFTITC